MIVIEIVNVLYYTAYVCKCLGMCANIKRKSFYRKVKTEVVSCSQTQYGWLVKRMLGNIFSGILTFSMYKDK